MYAVVGDVAGGDQPDDGACSTVVSSVSLWPTSIAYSRWPSRSSPASGMVGYSTGVGGIWPGNRRPRASRGRGGLLVHDREGAVGGVADRGRETLCSTEVPNQ